MPLLILACGGGLAGDGKDSQRIRGGTCNPCLQQVVAVVAARSDVTRGFSEDVSKPMSRPRSAVPDGRGCMTMYARLWWSTLFGGTLTLGWPLEEWQCAE